MSGEQLVEFEFDNFEDFFNSADDEILIHLGYYHPVKLYWMCMFLSIDLQLAEQVKQYQR